MVAFDVPLGVPSTALHFAGSHNFLDWLERRIFENDPVTSAVGWSPNRPFVLPVGKGSWTSVEQAATKQNYDLKRQIDLKVGSESMFKLVGAKQVGAAARALWSELLDARQHGARFRVWPFETPDLDGYGVTVAEIYPAAAYLTVLSRRPRSKGEASVRIDCVQEAELSDWFADLQITLHDRESAVASSDDFDAALTALATLRLVLENRPLATFTDPVAEGGMLCV